MRTLLFALLLAGATQLARAQQVICERPLGKVLDATTGYTNLDAPGEVVAVTSDSVLLHLNTSPGGFAGSAPVRSALVWIGRTQCDTATFAQLKGSTKGYNKVYIISARHDLLVLSTLTSSGNDSARVQLWSYSRRGQLHWTQVYRSKLQVEAAYGLLESPNQGAYFNSIFGGNIYLRSRLTRIDSLGRMQWQRTYSNGIKRDFSFGRPCYTSHGTLLLAGTVNDATTRELYGQIVEVNQQGDSLTSRAFFRYRFNTQAYLTGVRPLRDGGFLLVSRLDSSNASFCAFARLDAKLNVAWTYTYRQQSKPIPSEISQGLELADGTLLGLVSPANGVLHFLRLSAMGVLLNDYSFQPKYPSSGYNYSLTFLAIDSSFVLAGNGGGNYGASLVHLRIPGLPAVLPLPPVPPAQVFLATRAGGITWPGPAYPNPARNTATVPYRLPPGSGPARLVLYDLTGRRVRAQPVAAGAGAATLNTGGLAAGVYMLALEIAGQPSAVQRLLIGP